MTTATLVAPAFHTGPEYTQTLGPEVADLADLAGFAPDPEQRLILDAIFALNREGRSAAYETAVIAARQNLKTGVFLMAALGWLFIMEQRLVTWSAHEFSTTREALRDLAALIEGCRYLSRRLKTVRYANDDPSIELMSGQRVKFKARTRTGGRGLTGDKVVLDEAFALTADHMGALMPTVSARPDPQLVYGSSAGQAGSDILRGVRDRGRAGTSARLAYIEWCAPQGGCEDEQCRHEYGVQGCALDRRDLWQLANPLLNRTRANGTGLREETLQAERESLPPQEFGRERLGWWDEPGTAEAFGAGRWEACSTRARPKGRPDALAIASTVEQTAACIAAAAVHEGRVHVKPLVHGAGTGWVVEEAKAAQAKHKAPVAVDAKGPAASLIPHLKAAGVRIREVETPQAMDACADLYREVQEGTLSHESTAELEDAVAGAVKRAVGDRWLWGRKQSTSDISPLEAVTLAAWLARTKPRRRGGAYGF